MQKNSPLSNIFFKKGPLLEPRFHLKMRPLRCCTRQGSSLRSPWTRRNGLVAVSEIRYIKAVSRVECAETQNEELLSYGGYTHEISRSFCLLGRASRHLSYIICKRAGILPAFFCLKISEEFENWTQSHNQQSKQMSSWRSLIKVLQAYCPKLAWIC